MALGEDLRADQNVDIAVADALAHCRPGIFGPRGVAVDAQDARLREMADQRGFNALRALTHRGEIGITAIRAGCWW